MQEQMSKRITWSSDVKLNKADFYLSVSIGKANGNVLSSDSPLCMLCAQNLNYSEI